MKRKEQTIYKTCLYLNQEEREMLETLKIKSGYTKNAIIRQMIKGKFLEKMPQEKEKLDYLAQNNKIFIDNIHRIGSNINQIAYHLNIEKYPNANDILGNIQELKEVLSQYKEIIKSQKLNKFLKLTTYRRVK